jgi:6-phosphofructokinase 2
MGNILTVTLNPAIDKSSTIEALLFEKKMRCTTPTYEPGGGGINVARAIKKLGGNATAMYLAGGYTGNLFNELLAKEFISTIVIETENYTRENLIIYDNEKQHQYRFGMPGAAIKEKEWQQLLHNIERVGNIDFMVASGSLPPGVPLDIFARMAAIAKKKQAKFIIDTSGEALQHAVEEGAYLIKPNVTELSALAGAQDELTIDMVASTTQQMIAQNKCEVIMVSLGAKGALLVTKNETLQITPPPVQIKSTVGAGDSMVAGIVYSLTQGKTITEAAKYGVACGTAATLNAGTELCNLEDVTKLYALI